MSPSLNTRPSPKIRDSRGRSNRYSRNNRLSTRTGFMITCPRCRQKVDRQALQCPYCQNPLKAHGHPGMTLHQAIDGGYLCDSCVYHADDTCTFPQRPRALTCTLYKDMNRVEEAISPLPVNRSLRLWCARNKGLILLAVLILGSIGLAFINSRR
jgi:hypothetical protein